MYLIPVIFSQYDEVSNFVVRFASAKFSRRILSKRFDKQQMQAVLRKIPKHRFL
jgi:hypothetical protein